MRSTILFALGLLAKPSIAGVPLALCVLTLVRDRVLIVRTAREMAVWMAMVVAVAIGTSSVQSGMAPIHVDWWWRPIVALDALGFYAERVVAPVHLAADYGRTPGALGAHPGWLVMTLGPSLLVLAIALIDLRKRRLSWALAGVGLLGPVLGILTFAYQRISTVADHYMYLPMLAVAGGIATLVSLWSPTRQVIAAATLVVTFVGAGLTWQRARVWQTDAGFFGDMLERNPVSVSALANLSKTECEAGRLEGGAHYAQRALELDPTNVAALVNSAYCDFHQALYDNVLALRHRLSDPNVQYALDRDDWGTSRLLNTMAGANFNQGHMLSGWADLCQAMALDPDNGDLRANATDVAKQVAVLGEHLTCPGRLSWKTFLSNEVKP